MAGQSEHPKPGPQDGDAVAVRQAELNESVATGEDKGETPEGEDQESFPASDPPGNY